MEYFSRIRISDGFGKCVLHNSKFYSLPYDIITTLENNQFVKLKTWISHSFFDHTKLLLFSQIFCDNPVSNLLCLATCVSLGLNTPYPNNDSDDTNKLLEDIEVNIFNIFF